MTGKIIDKEKQDTVRRLVAEGSTVPEIAKILRTGPQVVAYWIKKLGLHIKLGKAGRKRTLTEEEITTIRQMYLSGATFMEIQRALGHPISGGQVRYWGKPSPGQKITRAQYEELLKRQIKDQEKD